MLLAFLFLFIHTAFADSVIGGTEILPKGVRALFYQNRNVKLGGEFSNSGEIQSLDVHTKVRVLDLVQANPQAEELLRPLSPEDRKLLEGTSIVDMTFRPDVSVQANIFGFAYGLSDRLMLAIGFPIITAQVRIREEIQMTRADLAAQAEQFRRKAALAKEEEKPRLQAIAAILDKIPEIKGAHVQDYLVNELGYDPLGNWQAQDIGDVRGFLHYNMLVYERYRQAARFGVIAPTGREDNPDLLNDFAFGNQAWGTFVESRHDWLLWPGRLTASAAIYYEYSLPSEKTMRTAGPQKVSREKEVIDFDRGDILDTRVGVGYYVLSDLEVYYQQEWHRKWADVYRGARGNYSWLSQGTDEATHAHAFGVTYSTVQRFLKKQWPIPMKVSLSQVNTISGRDTEYLDYTALEMQVYF
jgi:hypothetical protein